MRTHFTRQSKRRKLCAGGAGEAMELRALVSQLQHEREADYRRIIRVLHDEILSRLVRVGLDLAEVTGRPPESRTDRSLIWVEAAQGVRCAIKAAARVRAELTPPLLEHCGLEAAIAAAASAWEKRHGLPCRFVARTQVSRVRAPLVLELFRLFEDGLRTLTENCGPTSLEIDFIVSRASYRLCLRARTQPRAVVKNMTMSPTFVGIRERASRFGGYVVVRRTAPSLVTLLIDVPNR